MGAENDRWMVIHETPRQDVPSISVLPASASRSAFARRAPPVPGGDDFKEVMRALRAVSDSTEKKRRRRSMSALPVRGWESSSVSSMGKIMISYSSKG